MEKKCCGNCKWWVSGVGESEFGICMNPAVPTGRNCKAGMYCNGHEDKPNLKLHAPEEIQQKADLYPLMDESGSTIESSKMAIKMKVPEHSEVFIVGDAIRLCSLCRYEILEITTDALKLSPLDKDGLRRGSPLYFKIGEHILEKDWQMTMKIQSEK